MTRAIGPAVLLLLCCSCVRYGFDPHASATASDGSSLDRPLKVERLLGDAPRIDQGSGEARDLRLLEGSRPEGPRPDAPPPPAVSWLPMVSSTTQILTGVWGVGGEVFVTGYNGTLLRFTGAWAVEASPTLQHLYAVWGTSPTNLYAVGNGGSVLHRSSGGWSPVSGISFPPAQQLFGLRGSGATDVWLAGRDGTVRHFGGANWLTVTLPEAVDVSSLWVRASGEAFLLGGLSRTVYRYASVGAAPAVESIPGSLELSAIAGCPTATELYLVGVGGEAYRRVGTNWLPQLAPSNVSFQSVACISPSLVLAVGFAGTAGIVLRWNGSAWSDLSPKGVGPLNGIWVGPSDIYVVGAGGKILRASLP